MQVVSHKAALEMKRFLGHLECNYLPSVPQLASLAYRVRSF